MSVFTEELYQLFEDEVEKNKRYKYLDEFAEDMDKLHTYMIEGDMESFINLLKEIDLSKFKKCFTKKQRKYALLLLRMAIN